MDTMRRIASNQVLLDGKLLGLYVVEVAGNRVEKFYPLVEELPFTEWVQGEVYLHTTDDGTIKIDSPTGTLHKQTTSYKGE